MRKRKNELAVVEESEQPKPQPTNLVSYVAVIVSGYFQYNRILPSEITTIIASVHGELVRLVTGTSAQTGSHTPAVPIKKSVGDDFIICLEDGKKLTMLKRYLRSQHNMSPEEYRKKWDLPHDYPMVAPAYARLRSAFAKKIGLGRIPVGGKRAQRKRKGDGCLIVTH